MVRQAKLSASPQAAAISRIVCSEAPPNGLETTIGLRVPSSMAANWATSTRSLATSSGSPIDITKSMLGSASATRRGARDVGQSRARRRARCRGSATYRQSGPGAEVGAPVGELERRGVAAAGPQRPAARRGGERLLDELGRDAHPAAVHRRARGGAELTGAFVLHVDAGVGEQPQRGVVDAPAGGVIPDVQVGLIHRWSLRKRSSAEEESAAGGRRARLRRSRRRRDSAGAALAEELEPEAPEVAAGMGSREEVPGRQGDRAVQGAPCMTVTCDALEETRPPRLLPPPSPR